MNGKGYDPGTLLHLKLLLTMRVPLTKSFISFMRK
jgi:hypothetical protein